MDTTVTLFGLLAQQWGVFVPLLIVFIFKDFITNLVAGFYFYMGKDFDEEDIVFLNGRRGRITKIGLRRTKIYMFDSDSYLVIANERLPYLLLEKELPLNKKYKEIQKNGDVD